MKPIYRDSGNLTSLQVNKRTGGFKDWSTEETGSFALLVKKTLNIPFKEAYKVIEGKRTESRPKQSIKCSELNDDILESFTISHVGTLLPHHKHFLEKGISEEVLNLFKGGISMGGYMRNRYTFPIFDEDGIILGFSGRALLDGMNPKWKQKGKTRNWVYPLFLNRKEIQERGSVILVESIGDMLALWQKGVKNVLVLFGTKISKAIITALIFLNVEKIIVATNNEPDNNNIGNEAACKIKSKLEQVFDRVEISLPDEGDFGDMLENGSIEGWIEENT